MRLGTLKHECPYRLCGEGARIVAESFEEVDNDRLPEKAPALRVFAGPVEIGAAWKRTSKDNAVYHSVKLDDPSFPAPIFANLVEVEGGYALVWSR
jgi:uncharacterized protein (DUF736 family)